MANHFTTVWVEGLFSLGYREWAPCPPSRPHFAMYRGHEMIRDDGNVPRALSSQANRRLCLRCLSPEPILNRPTKRFMFLSFECCLRSHGIPDDEEMV